MSSLFNKLGRALPWMLFIGWYLGVALLLIGQIVNERLPPIDYQAYHDAAGAIEQGEAIYLSPDATQQIWLRMHQYETDVLNGQIQAGDRRIAGPYVYPPTLALWLVRLRLNAVSFVLVLLLSIYGFGWLWLKRSSAGAWWLGLVIGSWDVLFSFSFGNVELLLLFLALLAAWLIWRRQAIWAAPLMTLTVLVKPFFAFFFVSFGLLTLAVQPGQRLKELKRLMTAAAVVLVFLALEVIGWGADLRAQAAVYLSEAVSYQWLVLPLDQQTPLSIWNRTALQGLVNAGMPAQSAQFVTLGLGVLLTGLTLVRVWGRQLSFAAIFAPAFVLLYWLRPVGWTQPYVELVVVATLWPVLRGVFQRGLLLALAVALMTSHWLALIYTGQSRWLRFVTLQSADFPWETWLVLPLCWLALMWAAPRLTRGAEERRSR